MDLVQVRIKRLVGTSRYGWLETGDMLRTNAAYARHLVEDVAAAEYVIKPEKPKKQHKTTTKPATRTRKTEPEAPTEDQ